MKAMTALATLATAGLAMAVENPSVTTNGTEVTFHADGSQSLRVTDVYDDTITKVIKTGSSIVEYFPATAATYLALDIQRGQFRVQRADQLGSGTITLGNSATLMIPSVSITVPNKVVFAEGSYVAAFNNNDASITLTSVGSSLAAPNRTVKLGRTGSGYCKVGLSLTGADSDPLDRILTQGATDVTMDGGTIKIAAEAQSPFFQDDNKGAYAKNYAVTPAGVTMEVAEGAKVELGINPVFQSKTETVVAETYVPSNNSFENGATDWSYTSPNSFSEYSGVYANGSAFDTDGETAYTTTNGTHYLMLRRAADLTRKVNLPSAGKWRLTYEVGSRPSGGYSLDMTTDVKIDGTTIYTHPGFSAHADRHTFRRVETPVVELAAGEHILTLSQRDSNHGSGSQNYDFFVFERMEDVTHVATLNKTGAGTLVVGNLVDGNLVVSEGTLAVKDGTLQDMSVTVSDGTLEAIGMQLSDETSVTVSANGTLAFSACDGMNLLSNGRFEADGNSVRDATKKGTISGGWTFETMTETGLNGSGSGLQGNGGNVSATGPTTPDSAGPMTAYLREDSRVRQAFRVARTGKCRLSFLKSCRSVLFSSTMALSVKIDGERVLFSDSSTVGEYRAFSVDVELTAGEHTLAFETGEPSTRGSAGAMVFIDDVMLQTLVVQPELSAGVVRMTRGAKLRLDNEEKVVIGNFFVDGNRINGRKAEIESAGVTVIGNGQIRVGDVQGMVIIVR